MKAILTVGISASGKSTWADNYVADNQNTIKIERDSIRKDMCAIRKNIPQDKFQWKDWVWKWENEVTEYVNTLLSMAHTEGKDVIISDTNLNKKYREDLISKLVGMGYKVEIKEFPIKLEEAWKRDVSRPVSVGKDVIYKQYQQWLEYKGIEKYEHVCGLPKAIIVDIDGTLAHMDGKRSPFEYDKVGQDSVDGAVRLLVNHLSTVSQVFIFSGREETCYNQTLSWLYDNDIYFDALVMRKEGDHRCDTIVKKEMFDEHIKGEYNVLMVVDDRPKVCRMWREFGLKVFQVGDPHIEF